MPGSGFSNAGAVLQNVFKARLLASRPFRSPVAMDEIRCERAFMLFALLSCGSSSSYSGSASAKLFSVLFGRPGSLAAVALACLSMPAVISMR